MAGHQERQRSRVWLDESAQALIESHLAESVRRKTSAARMRKLVVEAKIERATPHDLRRTCLTWITRLGFGRDAMDRIANHKTSTVTDVYDRHGYADEDKRIMAAVARHVIGLVEGTETSNVISLR